MPDPSANPPTVEQPATPEPPLPEADPVQVAKQAANLGKEADLAKNVQSEVDREINLNRLNAARQFEQGVVWRRLNIGLGLGVGATVAASSAVAVAAKNSVAAIVLGAIATFGTGSLTTLNAGQRKSQAIAAGNAYREIEASARRLRFEFPYVSLDYALTAVTAMTTRRMVINKVAEPPSARALRRADLQERERQLYGRRLSFTERHWILFWDRKPPLLTPAAATRSPEATAETMV